ncbi:MAG: UDP-N-acetylmuramoyl-tripeptide--D-alanyl-D-alanine ligase [Patescibacteria group bacterium]
MDPISLFIILASILFFFWLFHIFRRLFFWLYFWQLKEYRVDRFLDGIKESRSIIFPRISFWSLILIVALYLSLSLATAHYIILLVGFFLYFILGFRAFYFVFKKEWNLPAFTSKMIILSLFFGGAILFLGIGNFVYFFRFLTSPFNYLFYLFLFEILFPLFVSIGIMLFQIPTHFIKRNIIKNAKRKREKFKSLIVIGITGSYGKTSTKEFLFEILSQKYKVSKTPANQNSEIGVAQTVLEELREDHQIFICEMGAYKRGEIKAICDIVHPQIGILTGISGQHISLFKSFKNIINTKYELIASLPKDGTAIFNGEDEECRNLAQRTTVKKYIYYTFSKLVTEIEAHNNIWAEEIHETPDFIEFKTRTSKGEERIRLNLLGKYNVENFLGAVTCAIHLGIPLSSIRENALKIRPSETSIRKKVGENQTVILDDSYSQNPDGVFAAIDHVNIYKGGKKIIVMPCLIELGKSAPSIHKSIGRAIGKVFDLAIITTPFYFEEIKIGAMESRMPKSKILFSNNPSDIKGKLKPYFSIGNVILIEGRVNQRIIASIIRRKNNFINHKTSDESFSTHL